MAKTMSKGFTWTLGVIGSILCIFAGVWAMDAHFTPREIHKLAMNQVTKQFSQIQSASELDRARAAVRHWTQQFVTLSVACAKSPNNVELRNLLNLATKEKCKAEAYLKNLESSR